MKVLKPIARVILVVLMIPATIQLFLTVLGLVASVRHSPETSSYLIGRFVGTLIILTVLIWGFRKLGEKKPDSK